MTVRYDPASAPPCSKKEQIGLIRLRDWAHARWDQIEDVTDDIQELGILSCRPVRGGGDWSVHADGRAWDSRWESRAEQEEFWQFLITNHVVLNVQRIIDYSGGRIWDVKAGTWYSAHPQTPGDQGGTPTHVERNWIGALDPRPIEQIVKEGTPTLPIGGAMGICASPLGGYYVFADDGGVFTFGDAKFYGSMGGQPLVKPVSGMAVMPEGDGYMLCARDGGVFSFGSAAHLTSDLLAAGKPIGLAGKKLAAPIVGIDINKGGKGYFLVGQDGGVFAFGNAKYAGNALNEIDYP